MSSAAPETSQSCILPEDYWLFKDEAAEATTEVCRFIFIIDKTRGKEEDWSDWIGMSQRRLIMTSSHFSFQVVWIFQIHSQCSSDSLYDCRAKRGTYTSYQFSSWLIVPLQVKGLSFLLLCSVLPHAALQGGIVDNVDIDSTRILWPIKPAKNRKICCISIAARETSTILPSSILCFVFNMF